MSIVLYLGWLYVLVMYCPSCGVQLAQSLSYCNRCGANLTPLKNLNENASLRTSAPASLQALTPDSVQSSTLNSLIWAIVVTTIIVLGMGLGALVLMRDGRIDEGLGRIFVMLCFVTLPIIEGLLVWQLVSSNRRVKRSSTKVGEHFSPSVQQHGSPDQLGAETARSLAEPREPVEAISSVTEHTTRAFEPSYRNER